jgi:ion channel-forming bestrophin family protein
MLTQNKYSIRHTLIWSKNFIYYFFIIDTVLVIMYEVLDYRWLAIPWQPISLVGIAVAFYLGFKNDSSYERLWEARKIWGGIVNFSRTFTVYCRDYITDDQSQVDISTNELHEIHKTLVYRHIAWMKALTYQLRVLKPWEHNSARDNQIRDRAGIHPNKNHFEKIKGYLAPDEYEYVCSKGNPASHILSLQSKHLRKIKRAGLLDNFRHLQLGRTISQFYDLQGQSERIKNYPFPRQYATVSLYFVWIFILLIPFSMLDVFTDMQYDHSIWLSIPFTVIISWIFLTMELVGEYSENPFEGLYNDVPISSIARSIEIDIREMLDETDLPEPIEPVGDMNILL